MINEQSKLKNNGTLFLPYVIIFGIAFLIMLPQIHSHIFMSGIDYYFHMSRTYETAMQIKTGHFSYFLSLFSWQHNARIVNAVYGPIGGYISGLILLLTKSWFRWGIIVSFLALFIAGSTMYHLGRYWHVRPVINLLISLLYMLSTPLKDFVYARTFAGFGAVLVPLVFLMISEILVKKDVNPIKFAVILVIIIEIHLMTFVISLVSLGFCIILAIILAKRTRRSLIVHVCESAFLTIVLSFNVWGSILEVYSSNPHHIISTTWYNYRIGTQPTNTIMNITFRGSIFRTPSIIGLLVLFLIVITLIMWLMHVKRTNYVISVLMIIGLVALWLSSDLFPWQTAIRHLSILTNLIQFPKRFLPFSLVPLYLSAGYFFTYFVRKKSMPRFRLSVVLILLTVIVGWNWQSDYERLQHLDNYYQVHVINWLNTQWLSKPNDHKLRVSLNNNHPGDFIYMVSRATSDYLPTTDRMGAKKNAELKPFYNNKYFLEHLFVGKWSVPSHGKETLYMKSKKKRVRYIPFIKYAHTQVNLNHHYIDPKINKIGAMRVSLKKGINRLSLQYVPSSWFKIGIIISILTWLILIIYVLYLTFGKFITI